MKTSQKHIVFAREKLTVALQKTDKNTKSLLQALLSKLKVTLLQAIRGFCWFKAHPGPADELLQAL